MTDFAPAPVATLTATALTEVVRNILSGPLSQSAKQDLLFLEAWERDPLPGLGAIRRARQIRRANPAIAAAIRSELTAH